MDTKLFRAERRTTVVTREGRVELPDVGFGHGQEVDVIVLEAEPRDAVAVVNRLRRTILKDDDPCAPVLSPNEWEANA